MSFFYFKKWYFDLISNDSNQALYLYFIFTRNLGFNLSHVAINFYNGKSNHIKLSKSFFKKPKFTGKSFLINDNSFEKIEDNYQIKIQLKQIYLELTYHSLESEWSLNGSGNIINKNDKKLLWIVPQPKADIKGKMIYNNNEIFLRGYGYQDIVEMNLPFWNLPIKELYWGRAHCENYTIIYNRLISKNDKLIQNLYAVSNNKLLYNGDSFNFNHYERNNFTEITNEKLNLQLKHKSIIEDAPIVTTERIKNTFLNQLLTRISGNPLEKKIVSDALLITDEKIFKGYSIHERVKW